MINLSSLKVKTGQTLERVQFWWQPEPLELTTIRGNISALAANEATLPDFVRDCAVTMKYLRLLGDLDWPNFPERPDGAWPGPQPHPRAPYLAAYLVKINEGHKYMTSLRTYLTEHPALVWALGFQLTPDTPDLPYPFDVEKGVPSAKQLGRVLRELPTEMTAFLLQSTVKLLQDELPDELGFGHDVSMDTNIFWRGWSRIIPKLTFQKANG